MVKRRYALLDLLIQKGYFYNREWVRFGKRFDDICMEFEHFLTKKKRYLWIRKCLCKRKSFLGRRWNRHVSAYLSGKPPCGNKFSEGKKPYLQGPLKNRGIYADSDCWQEILVEAFSFDESIYDCCCCLYRETEAVHRINEGKCLCRVGEFVYEDVLLAEANKDAKYKYLYVAQIETVRQETGQKLSIRQFIEYIQNKNPRFYIMRTKAPLEKIHLPDGRAINMRNETEDKEDKRCW